MSRIFFYLKGHTYCHEYKWTRMNTWSSRLMRAGRDTLMNTMIFLHSYVHNKKGADGRDPQSVEIYKNETHTRHQWDCPDRAMQSEGDTDETHTVIFITYCQSHYADLEWGDRAALDPNYVPFSRRGYQKPRKVWNTHAWVHRHYFCDIYFSSWHSETAVSNMRTCRADSFSD